MFKHDFGRVSSFALKADDTRPELQKLILGLTKQAIDIAHLLREFFAQLSIEQTHTAWFGVANALHKLYIERKNLLSNGFHFSVD